MRSAPWHVKGINPQARDTAREAARRSGMSVGQWLNAVILDRTDHVGDEEDGRFHQRMASGRGEHLASINARLDDLGRQIARLVGHRGSEPGIEARDGDVSQRIADTVARLDQRLDHHLLAERRSSARGPEPWRNSVDQALARLGRARVRAAASLVEDSAPDLSVEQTVAEIAARQRALDGEFSAPPAAAGAGPQCRLDAVVEGLRVDLAEIRRVAAEAMPRRAIEALDAEVRSLARRLDEGRERAADAPAIAGLEQGLREVRDALRGLAPAESLAGVDEAMRTLSARIDMVAAGRQDPAVLHNLENAIAALRHDVGQVASRDALAALSQEVRTLADRIDRGAPPVASADILGNLDRRIGSIADALEAVRAQSERNATPEFDRLVNSLSDKLERIQATPGDTLSRGAQLALGGLEDRIAKLVEKLDASEGRLGHLEAIERGMAELLVHLEGLRANPPGAATHPEMAPAAPVAALSQDIAALRRAQSAGEARTQHRLEAVHDRIATVADRLATIETAIRRKPSDQALPPGRETRAAPARIAFAPAGGPSDATAPAAASEPGSPLASGLIGVSRRAPSPAPRAATRPKPVPGLRLPADPDLPPDHPLEPGSGPPRARAAVISAATISAADRIAVSERLVRAAKAGAAAGAECKSGYLQAARRAARYAAQGDMRSEDPGPDDPEAGAGKLSQRFKGLVIGLGVAVLIGAALRYAATHLEFAELAMPAAPVTVQVAEPPVTASPRAVAAPEEPRFAVGPAAGSKVLSTEPDLLPGPTSDRAPSIVAPVAPAAPVEPVAPAAPVAPAPRAGGADEKLPIAPVVSPPARAAAEVTGTLPVRPATRAAAPIGGAAAAEILPAAIGGKMLIAAASAGDPAAAYEVATRFAEGRGVPQNLAEAAIWYERAAKGGLAPALFRLGALYEKGSGVAKDLNEARRLYLAAADKGNANAMHNIGVLYAEGIDGKPDFKSAAQWFRKSSTFGIADSQYNLAVLYARGIGVERDLGEAFQWFALAAKGGDIEAAKKREEIAAALDQRTLAALRHAVDTWVPDRPPAEASVVRPPAGGWDQAEPAKPKPRARTPARGPAAPI